MLKIEIKWYLKNLKMQEEFFMTELIKYSQRKQNTSSLIDDSISKWKINLIACEKDHFNNLEIKPYTGIDSHWKNSAVRQNVDCYVQI